MQRFPAAFSGRQKGTPKEGWNFGFIVGQLRNCGADTCSCSVLHFTVDTHDSLPEHFGGGFETSEATFIMSHLCVVRVLTKHTITNIAFHKSKTAGDILLHIKGKKKKKQ